jgi:hypothetical protein
MQNKKYSKENKLKYYSGRYNERELKLKQLRMKDMM